jgi:hypothetical protein
MPIHWDARDPLARAAVANLLADNMPEQCQDCGGYKTNDTTPGWVFKEHEICECPDAEPDNPTYTRIARISVTVDRKWLTAEGDYELLDGWKEIKEAFTKSLNSSNLMRVDVKIEFIEWDGEPEVQKENDDDNKD